MSLTRLFVVIALSAGICAAQTTSDKLSKPPEPEAIGVYFYLDPSTQTLKRLPQEDWKRHNQGARTVTQDIEIIGTASSFHISEDKPVFVFKAADDKDAPNVNLFQCTIKGKNRAYEVGRWKGRDFTPSHGLVVTVAKFGESSYKLTSDAPLAAGEYAIVKGPKVVTFSIGPAEK